MRTLVLVLLSAYSSQALQCWTCDNAHSDEECMEKGELQACHENEESCMTEIRRGGWGDEPMITKRCKQGLACHNNYIQNPRDAWEPTQCNAKIPSSVCRCCCNDEDGCNKFANEDCNQINDPCAPKPCGVHGECQRIDDVNYHCDCDEGCAFINGTCIVLECPLLGDVVYGTKNCSGPEHVQGTECQFTCTKDGYSLHPSDNGEITCQTNGKWDDIKPCCARKCPDFAVMDLVVLMDSSSSVKSHNWEQMKAFVKLLLGDFKVAPDLAFLSVVRYNAQVDAETQIMLKDFPNNRSALLDKFDEIPYNGQGTMTGQAIDYVTDVLLKEENGNRQSVQDIVLIITDGASQDDVKEPSRRLRETGAEILVLPIKATGTLDMQQLKEMAGPGNDRNIFMTAVERGFEALDGTFASEVTKGVCKDPCKHVISEDEIESLIDVFKGRMIG